MSGTDDSTPLPDDVTSYLNGWLGDAWRARGWHGDASARAYFRVSTSSGAQYMLAYYPDSVREGLIRFVNAYRAIEGHARVPSIIRHGDATIVQDDVGDVTVYDLLRRDRDDGLRHYREAIDLLVEFQRSPQAARNINPPFDSARFRSELAMTSEYYVERLSGVVADPRLDAIFTSLCDEIVQHPYVLCHRDYHGQNLHLHQQTLYMIDYQDLRMGPDTYDLASLLRDRGVAAIIGRDEELSMLEYYRQRIGTDDAIRDRYFANLLQRSIKILGTFARQAVERGRMHYLAFIPTALDSIRVCCSELPRYADLLELLPMKYDDARSPQA
jgi:N-acetylmuramate 1-kinase